MFQKPQQFKSYVADIKSNADRQTDGFQSYNIDLMRFIYLARKFSVAVGSNLNCTNPQLSEHVSVLK